MGIIWNLSVIYNELNHENQKKDSYTAEMAEKKLCKGSHGEKNSYRL